ncbi:cysteine-rich receptor-like protein kinase 8 [Tanacetum coccineum]
MQQMNSLCAEEELDQHQFVAGIACLSSNLEFLEILVGWSYDSGASDHMTPKKDSIFDPYQLKIKPQIKLTNGDSSVISHVGKVKLSNGSVLKDVLVVPSFKFSLLSVPKLTQDSQCMVSFYPTFRVVQDLTTNMTGLGHVSDAKLKHIHDLPISLNKSSFDKCLSCPIAKFTNLPYSLSESHSTTIFELVHIDIWGPYKVPTNGKFRYFLTIVDDCSRGTWVYLLEQKTDAFMALKSFIKFVATQFEKQVKIVRSDNALEFVKGQCGPYLESLGIVHQTSYVDRPQQNDRFWGDCITTATYLINRIPSSVIGNKTPYQVPLKKKPVYDHLRVFGCLAVVSNPSRTTDKFDPRGVPCDPVSFKEVVLDQEWCVAMDLELKALDDNGTWELTTLHVGKKVIGSYWIYKTKLKADGNVERKKARLVVNGNNQRHGVDYQETFAPVAKIVTLRSFLAVDALKGYIGKGQKVSTVKSLDSTMLQADVGTPLSDPEVYRRAIGKHIYLTITRPNICYTVKLLSQFMQSPTSVHMQEVKHVLRLGKLSNDKKINNWILHSFRRFSNQLEVKKQVVISRSLVEAEYRAMALTCYEVTWFVSLLKDLGIKNLEPVDPFCGNQAALYIVANPIFHARTKHIEVDCHYVRDQLKTGIIKPSYVHTKSQLVDVFTKVVSVDQHTKLLSMLGTPLCCDDIHDVTPRVSTLAGCDRLVSEPLVIENSLISLNRGSFDVIVGMDWLSKRKFGVVCYEKVVRIHLVPEATSVAKSRYRLAPLEMQELSEQLRELQDKANVVGDGLSRKERVKSRRVRGMILAAQSEVFKQENVLAERLHGLDPQMERKRDESVYFMDRIWVLLVGSVMDEAHASRYLVHPGADKTYYNLGDMYW